MSDNFDAKRARSKRPLPIWVDALLRDCSTFEADELGAYLRILMFMWSTPTLSLPDDPRRLSNAAGVSLKLWNGRVGKLIRPLLCETDHGVSQKRLIKEADYVEGSVLKQSKKAGERWHNTGTDSSPTASGVSLDHYSQEKTKNKANPLKNNDLGHAMAIPRDSRGITPDFGENDEGKSQKSSTLHTRRETNDVSREEGENQANPLKSNDPDNAVAVPRMMPTQQPNNPTYIGGGGGYARAPTREADDPVKSNPDLRVEILTAMGLDETGQLGPNGKLVGTRADMIAAHHWQNALGLTSTEIVETVQDVMRSKPDGPPSAFKYFTPAMQRLADAKAAPPPEIGGTNDTGSHQAHTGRANHGHRRRSPHDARLEAFLRVGRELDKREAENRSDD